MGWDRVRARASCAWRAARRNSRTHVRVAREAPTRWHLAPAFAIFLALSLRARTCFHCCAVTRVPCRRLWQDGQGSMGHFERHQAARIEKARWTKRLWRRRSRRRPAHNADACVDRRLAEMMHRFSVLEAAEGRSSRGRAVFARRSQDHAVHLCPVFFA